MLEGIITSKATRKLLGFLYSNPNEKYYTRQLERLTGLPVNAVRRELSKLEKTNFLISKEEGRVKYYWVNKKNPIFEELKSIVLKTQVIGENLRKLVEKIADIKIAFIYGSVAKGIETAQSDIDLIIIGNIDSVKLHSEISKIEDLIKRTINYNNLSEKDAKNKKTDFLKRVFTEEKIFLVGDEDELRALIGTK